MFSLVLLVPLLAGRYKFVQVIGQGQSSILIAAEVRKQNSYTVLSTFVTTSSITIGFKWWWVKLQVIFEMSLMHN